MDELKREYKSKTQSVLRELAERTTNIEFITMKELQLFLERLEKAIHKRVCDYVQKQIEVFRLNQIVNDEIDSPHETRGASSQTQVLTQGLSNQLPDIESNLGSVNSNELKKDINNTTNSEPANLNKLPKLATKILNQWLCDHIDDPYPTIEEKMLLAAKTKLSLRQVGFALT